MTNDAKGTSGPARKRAPAKTTKRAPTARPRAAAPLPPAPRPGWYVDPADTSTQRYWDGEGWIGPAVSAALDLAGQGPDYAGQIPAPAAGSGPADENGGRITFRGRSMRVHDLSLEQIGVWRRIVRRFEDVDKPLPENATEEQRAARSKANGRALDRCLDIIMSVLVDESDQDWIETLLLTRQVRLPEALKIIDQAVEAFDASHAPAGEATNRAERRAQPKAQRRA